MAAAAAPEAAASNNIDGAIEGDIAIVQLQPQYFSGLEALQRAAYPTLAEHEILCERHFASHYAIFPEGQHVALHLPTQRVIGMNCGLFIDFDLQNPQHTFNEITGNLSLSTHNYDGEYYYGADISVHPEFRRRGIGTRLYNCRKMVVRQFSKRGIISGGLLPGYDKFKNEMTAQEYIDKVVSGALVDSTLTFQLRSGFKCLGAIEGYIEDSASDNWASLIYWPNPDHPGVD